LLVKGWIQSRNARAKLEYDSLMWETFAHSICKRNLKPNPYIMDTVKHLLLIANGEFPGLKPVNNDDNLLPVSAIETAYTEDYGLKYAPVIMGPSILSANSKNADTVYYSLAYPTLLEGTPVIRHPPSIISEIQEIKSLMNTFENVHTTSYSSDPMKNMVFRYFYAGEDKFGELLHSRDITAYDCNMHQILTTKFSGKDFPAHGHIFRGYIQIQKMSNQTG